MVKGVKSVDLTVLIDTSFNTVQSGFKFIIDGVQLVLGRLYDVRLAVANFHEVKFKLDQYIDEEDQLNALQNLSYRLQYGSRLAEGVHAVHTTIYNGSAGDRPGVQDVILVMLYTDDIIQESLEDSVAEAKSDGIHIIAVGIRTRSNHWQNILNMIVSEPLEDNQLIATSYEALLDMDKEIAEVIKRSIS
ncbi:Collagen alpha-1(XII) chain [Mizuhopecten yessoensis]|uniref:Collagen alpha-1(XII) chain n=1 Tax=Mizuhopecten yessoensis TaxID=6573 RepID=A0A210QRP3_MIZYE|nr:Collagen alpha-1(XII) chain [Mizuhopecten yessoensis]